MTDQPVTLNCTEILAGVKTLERFHERGSEGGQGGGCSTNLVVPVSSESGRFALRGPLQCELCKECGMNQCNPTKTDYFRALQPL